MTSLLESHVLHDVDAALPPTSELRTIPTDHMTNNTAERTGKFMVFTRCDESDVRRTRDA